MDKVLRLTVLDVLPFVQAFYLLQGNGCGGLLHIVLDDGNIENGHIEWCVDQAIERGDVYAERLGRLLLAMTKTQRRKVCRSKIVGTGDLLPGYARVFLDSVGVLH